MVPNRAAGGRARAARLTPLQLSEAASRAGKARWAKQRKAEQDQELLSYLREIDGVTGAIAVLVPVQAAADCRQRPLPTYPGRAIALPLPAVTGGELAPGGRALVRLGLMLALPDAFGLLVQPVPELAASCGVLAFDAPPALDGSMRALLVNLGSSPFLWRSGATVAQGVLAPIARAVLRLNPLS